MKNTKVVPGIDVFLRGDLSHLKNRKIAVVSNYSSLNSDIVPTIELLHEKKELNITSLYAPEHGLWGKFQAGEDVPSYIDENTGLPVFSLYDQSREKEIPLSDNMDERMRSFDISDSGKIINQKELQNIDTIIFDLQDIGTRIYTYISTLGYLMQAVSGTDIELIILDRPNPITGTHIEGPVLEYPGYSSFIGFYSIPVRHGLTMGELALLFNDQIYSNSVKITIIKAKNWKRNIWFDQSGLTWINPSPNIPTLNSATVYPGMVFLEGTNISEGRGTTIPFEIFGAPWINGKMVSYELAKKKIKGVEFRETFFTPAFSKYSGESCSGIRLFVTDRNNYSPFITILHILKTTKEIYPDKMLIYKKYFNMTAGNSWLHDKILSGSNIEDIVDLYQKRLSEFGKNREKYFLYD